jgi:hypothetical protein
MTAEYDYCRHIDAITLSDAISLRSIRHAGFMPPYGFSFSISAIIFRRHCRAAAASAGFQAGAAAAAIVFADVPFATSLIFTLIYFDIADIAER